MRTPGGVPKNTLKKYIEYLEAAFLIKQVRRIDQSGKRFQRDNYFKLYLTNPSLRSALFAPLTATDDLVGHLVETAIYAQWMHHDWFTPWYARWNNGEVDIVSLSSRTLKPLWALEIKWSNRFYEKPRELKSLLQFCKENKLDRALVSSIDKDGEKTVDDVIFSTPRRHLYLYSGKKNPGDEKQDVGRYGSIGKSFLGSYSIPYFLLNPNC